MCNNIKCAGQYTVVDVINNNISRNVQRRMCEHVVQGIYIAAIQMLENDKYILLMIKDYYIESCWCYETEFEFRSLMAWGKKLLLVSQFLPSCPRSIYLGLYLSSFSKCHFSLKCWEFMKCTPTFKLKYKSKLSHFLKLRITLTLPVI